MYENNLSETVRLRLNENDMNYLRNLSARRSLTISECIRGIIGEYRRLDTNLQKGGKLSYGDTKTDINNQL